MSGACATNGKKLCGRVCATTPVPNNRRVDCDNMDKVPCLETRHTT